MKLYIRILILFNIVVFSSCVRSLTPSKTPETERIITYDEDISVIRPKYEPREEKEVLSNTKPTENNNTLLSPPNVNESVDAAINKMVERNKSISTTQGYRIQIFSGNNRSDYEQARGYILQYFPNLEVYVSYSQPTYKLKVGDFLTRSDAEKYLTDLQNRFVGAKIIYDNIDYKKGLTTK